MTDLTQREFRIGFLLMQGFTLPQVAGAMKLDLRTVAYNCKNMCRKLECADLDMLIATLRRMLAT